MSTEESSPRFQAALRDFRRARQRAALENIMAQLTGRSSRLLPYEDVLQKLRAGEPVDRGLQMIPINAIVGSVGRYSDFNRSFLPQRANAEKRWARVRATFDDVEGFPPIVVYKLGDVYFVLDGNHRVSVARVLDADFIPAYVTEVEAKVPLTPDVQPDELICQAQYASFLNETHLDDLRPEADLTVTAPGQYRVLKGEINRYWEWLRREKGEDIPYEQAVAGWYDEIYLPLVEVIRRRGLLRYFPERTETDLYAWIVQHRQELAEELGWEVDRTSVAHDLVQRFSPNPQQVFTRVKERLLDLVTPDPLEAGPATGRWRKDVVDIGREQRLFANILVPVTGRAGPWPALDQALVVARREEGRVHGLHVVAGDEEVEIPEEALREEFGLRCEGAGVDGELTMERGRITRTICDRAYWNDLVVIGLSHLPGPQPGDRLTSGFSTIVRRCGRPVLAVPGPVSVLERPLLAYDGSPKAKEALFIGAYVAGKWRLPLTVLAVAGEAGAERDAAEALTGARQYLQSRRVDAFYFVERGEVAPTLRRVAQAQECDWLIMGGYGFRPLLEVILGSTVDEVLRWRRWPVLICR